MPGSKRRALKNLLSPSHHADKSPSAATSSSAIHPVDSNTSLASVSASSTASDPANYLTDQQLDADLELEKMSQRQNSIGTGQVPELDKLPPAERVPPPPPPKAVGRPGEVVMGLNGELMLNPANDANGQATAATPPGGLSAGGAGAKKKSSKQKFEERQVSISVLELATDFGAGRVGCTCGVRERLCCVRRGERASTRRSRDRTARTPLVSDLHIRSSVCHWAG